MAKEQKFNGSPSDGGKSSTSHKGGKAGISPKTLNGQRAQGRCNAALSFLKRYAFIITMTLNMTIDSLGMAVRSQFRYNFFRQQHEDELKSYNRSIDCGQETSPAVQAIEDKISQEASMWNMYDWFALMPSMMVASVILGMKSDQIGRRFLFLFPFVTSIAESGLLMAILWYKLHYGWTILGGFIWGASGGGISMHFASLALVSDTYGKQKSDTDTSEKSVKDEDTDLDMSRESSRTLTFVLIDIANLVGGGAMGFASGDIIKALGFFYTTLIVISVKAGIFLFAFFFIEESGQQKKSISFIVPLKVIYRTLKDPRKRLTLILVNLAHILIVFAAVTEMTIVRTYQMSPPFCLNTQELGWLSGETRVNGIFSIPLLWVWRKLSFAESTIAAIGSASEAAGQYLLAVVRLKWVFFAAPVIAIPGRLSATMAKAITSRIIGRTALASTFAVMMLSSEIFAFMGTVVGNYVYQYTVSTAPTTFLYLAASSFAMSSIFFVGETFNHRRLQGSEAAAAELKIQS